MFFYIDMELCDLHLGQYMRNEITGIRGLLEWPRVVSEGHLPFLICAIMQQIIRGLVFIHSKGETHRDLSPQNGILHHQSKGCGLTLNSVVF
jgi:serine/threonine protein kinase